MAQVFDGFGADTAASPPANWTHYSGGAWTALVANDGAAEGGKVLRFTASGGDEPQYLVHTGLGSVSAPCEVASKWKIRSGELNTANFLPIACIFVSPTDDTCYALIWFGGTPQFRIAVVSATGTLTGNLGSATPFTPAVDTWYGCRFQIDADDILRARAWLWDEPPVTVSDETAHHIGQLVIDDVPLPAIRDLLGLTDDELRAHLRRAVQLSVAGDPRLGTMVARGAEAAAICAEAWTSK